MIKLYFVFLLLASMKCQKYWKLRTEELHFIIKARKMHFIDFESIDSFMRYDHEYGFSNVISFLTSL